MIAREGRQRARPRLPARAARGDRRLRRLRRRDRRAGPRGRRRPRPRPAARRQGRRPERGRRAGRAARSSPSRTPTALGAGRAAPPGRAASPTRRSATSAARSASPTPEGDNLEGAYWRYEMAVRGDGVGAGRRHRRQRRDLRGPPRRLRPARRPPAATTSRFPFALAKRGLRSLYAPAARAEEKMVPTLEGEFARKRRMMVGLWDIVDRRGDASPARLPAALRLRARLAPAAALPDPVPAPDRARRERRPARRGLGLRGHPRRSRSRCSPPPLLGRVVPLAPLRFARYYVMVTASIAAGLWDRLRRGAAAAPGRRRRGRGDAARLRHRSSPALALRPALAAAR